MEKAKKQLKQLLIKEVKKIKKIKLLECEKKELTKQLYELENKITDLNQLGRKLKKEDIPNLSEEVLYKVAINLANKMLPLPWDQLPDINSMWDYITEGMSFEELKDSVKEAANDRLAGEGFGVEDFMVDEGMGVGFVMKRNRNVKPTEKAREEQS